jgi:hypothetical protein
MDLILANGAVSLDCDCIYRGYREDNPNVFIIHTRYLLLTSLRQALEQEEPANRELLLHLR